MKKVLLVVMSMLLFTAFSASAKPTKFKNIKNLGRNLKWEKL